ncbi:MAG: hypothetical protein O2805_12660 [Proteobacteria bacterium]|nr:hypothetical protein [Pseudomonadota bacterium]
MPLGSAPTRAVVFAAIHANSLYALDNSTTMARDYYEAVHYALTAYPKSAQKGQEEFEFDTAALSKALLDVQVWLNRNLAGSTSEVHYATRYS